MGLLLFVLNYLLLLKQFDLCCESVDRLRRWRATARLCRWCFPKSFEWWWMSFPIMVPEIYVFPVCTPVNLSVMFVVCLWCDDSFFLSYNMKKEYLTTHLSSCKFTDLIFNIIQWHTRWFEWGQFSLTIVFGGMWALNSWPDFLAGW